VYLGLKKITANNAIANITTYRVKELKDQCSNSGEVEKNEHNI